MHNWYYDEQEVQRRVDQRLHRDAIGGLWTELGDLQLSFLIEQGLRPSHKLLDIGCGAGRLAVKVVPLLDQGNYFGIDVSTALLSAAKEELDAIGVGSRLHGNALQATPNFSLDAVTPEFSFGIAQSVFTHLPISEFRRCLEAVAPNFRNARLFATFFLAPKDGINELRQEPGGIITFANKDPFHFTADEIAEAAELSGWKMNWLRDWAHPRNQKIAEFIRVR